MSTESTAPHEQLHPGQLVISNTVTLHHADAAPGAQDWEVQITFTFAGAGSTVSGWGITEQGAAIRATHALADLLAQIEVDEAEAGDMSTADGLGGDPA